MGDASVVTLPERVGGPGRIDGRPAMEWVAAHQRDLVDAAMAELRDGTVGDDAERAAQLRWIMDYNIRLFVRVASGTATLDEETASELVASAALRASEGFPVENLLETYVGGTAAIWRWIAAHARPEELADLTALTSELFDYLRGLMALVVRGFDREASRVRLGQRDARFAVYSALLAGADLDQASARAGLPIASRYLVLAAHLGDENSAPRFAEYTSASRRSNALLGTFDSLAAGEVLAVVGDPHSTALIPLADTVQPDEHARVQQAVLALSRGLQTPVHMGAVVASADEVPDAIARAEEILELVRATDMEPGAWFLDDVLLPYQLTRPGPAHDLLYARLEVLSQHPDWDATLRASARNGWDRSRTASELHVHPNTVDYRLRRMAEATGLDAGDPAQRATVLAALYVRALRSGSVDR